MRDRGGGEVARTLVLISVSACSWYSESLLESTFSFRRVSACVRDFWGVDTDDMLSVSLSWREV